MNPKKPEPIKSKSAGISMPPELAAEARVVAAQQRSTTFSGWVQRVVAEAVEAHHRVKLLAEQLEESGRRDLAPSAQLKRKTAATKAALAAGVVKAKKTHDKNRK
jgi:hypothetical protein